jgi:ABC-type bacteriocin/lantibiotic exporter with double-glycine peptidase domain
LIFQIIKILFSIYYLFYETKYIHSFKERIASRLMHNYFSQNYIFFIKNNSAKLLRNITYGVDMSVVFLFQFLKVLLDLIMLSFIFIFLSFYNFQITFFLISGVLLFFYIYTFNFKNKL